MNFDKAMWVLEISEFFERNGRLSLAGSEVLAFGSHFSAKFQPILDCFISNFKLKYKDSENVKIDCLGTALFSVHQIKQKYFFGDTRY